MGWSFLDSGSWATGRRGFTTTPEPTWCPIRKGNRCEIVTEENFTGVAWECSQESGGRETFEAATRTTVAWLQENKEGCKSLGQDCQVTNWRRQRSTTVLRRFLRPFLREILRHILHCGGTFQAIIVKIAAKHLQNDLLN